MIKPKLKICSNCNIPSVLWKSTPKLCKKCAAISKPVTPPKPRTPIAKLSDKQKKVQVAYIALRSVYMIQHPICEARVCCQGAKSHDLHHKNGRGEYFLDTSTWLATCRPCHSWIENHPIEAKQLNLSGNRLDKK